MVDLALLHTFVDCVSHRNVVLHACTCVHHYPCHACLVPPPCARTHGAGDSVGLSRLRRENSALQKEIDALKKQLANRVITDSPLKGADGGH